MKDITGTVFQLRIYIPNLLPTLLILDSRILYNYIFLVTFKTKDYISTKKKEHEYT